MRIIFFILIVIGVNSSGATEGALTGQEIVKRSDDVRNPHVPFRLENRLTEYESGVVKNEVQLVGYSKGDPKTGQFKNVVIYKKPARDFGKIVLFNGTVMWFYDPNSKSSVRISAQQRLIGQASEGDVVTVNFANDYAAKLLKEESLDDADRSKRLCWQLELAPKNEGAVYNKIEYWIEKGTFRPVKAKFFSDSGRLLKIAYYHKYEKYLGAERPTEVIIIDAVNSKLVTTMNFSNIQEKTIPDNWFQRDSLPLIKPE